MVRPVETEERYGSLILPQTTREREFTRNQCEVLEVGDYEICEDEDCSRTHVLDHYFDAAFAHKTDPRIKPQAWVLVEQASLIEADHDQKTYYVRIADIAAVFTEGA